MSNRPKRRKGKGFTPANQRTKTLFHLYMPEESIVEIRAEATDPEVAKLIYNLFKKMLSQLTKQFI